MNSKVDKHSHKLDNNMRIKRKAVSNKLAVDMPVESAQPSVAHDSVVRSGSVVVSDHGLLLSTGHDDHLDTGAANMAGTFMPVAPVLGEGSSGSRVSAPPDTFLYAHGCRVSHAVQHVNPTEFLPVQIPTVDGSVSMFTSANTGQQPFLGASQIPAFQAFPVNQRGGHSRSLFHNGPLILDFSCARILPNQEPTEYSYNPGRNGPETTPSGRRSRARRSHVRNRQAAPTQGPLAPPQRQGAPLDYISFGGCDQTCQHCYALFWREEKKAGMPVSAPPQYQKCCAGGRVVLRAYADYPGYIMGLIQFLNDNNNLVRLFRTARDKLLEADIPDFQIRLFGVVGAQRYDLPAGDTIGAIVYEGGPESATDYDIVIERHSREAENVNKLHPRYMALQFPLLFVYGEEGYHLSLTIRNIEDSEIQAEKRMSMKAFYAYQLYDRAGRHSLITRAMKIPSLIPTGFSCILLDKKGTAIQANADMQEKERFERDLQINCVYRIQGFGFEKTDNWGKTLDNDMTLCFGKHTQVDLLTDDDYPAHYFSFAAYNELGGRLEKKNPILTDYIGYVHNVEKTKEYGGATGNKIRLRNIGIRNLKYNQNNPTTPPLQLQTERSADWEQERSRNRVALGTLLLIDPNTQQRVLFTQDVMILNVDTTQDWYYQKCDECGGKLRYGYVHGHCHPYGTQPNPQKSYSFRIVVTDGTGNATITCFSPQTDGLIKDINILLEEVANKDPQVTPPQILALQNTRHVLQFRFAKPAGKGPPTFVLQKVMDHRPAILTGPSEGPSSPHVIATETQATTEVSPPPATPTASQDTPANTTDATRLPSSSTVRKELFGQSPEQESEPETKKQKTD
ncbi:DNA helicase Pif1-like protein [Artemisia annua]|uniref:DNA helicase Pif1-like protein n=1 Tax=Artemisia annua TaxID=35608 RepID=A0A2U1NBW7_ARTAN|nr:DNA helicase Pif1-like protein [Artemisia annua]